jgi:hypothetical protein
MGIHVGHVVVDGQIDSVAVRARFPDRVAELPEGGLLAPEAIAEAFWDLHRQPRSAWTWEIDIRPWTERW